MTGFELTAVIPSRNGMPLVLDAVRSALEQTLPPAEIIVVVDASTDGTEEALSATFGDRVHIVRGQFGSAAAARNAGWRAATSTWIGFMDADDLWFPEKVQTAADLLEGRPAAGWFFSDGAFRTLDGELHASWLKMYADLTEPYLGHPVAELIQVNFILTSSVVVSRQALEALGGFHEGMSHAEDVDMWIRLARHSPATASRRALVRYQHREGGLTRNTQARLQGDIQLFERLCQDPALDARLRGMAARRVRMAHFKLAYEALRERRARDARRHLRSAWSRQRALPVAMAWLLSCLPTSLVQALRRQTWMKQKLGAPALRLRRVVLETPPDAFAALSVRKPI